MSDKDFLALLTSPRTRAELAAATGDCDRQVRKRIQRLRERGYNIINRMNGAGYYLASDEEAMRYVRMRRKRALAEFRAASLMEMRCTHKDGIKIPVRAHFRTLGRKADICTGQITLENNE